MAEKKKEKHDDLQKAVATHKAPHVKVPLVLTPLQGFVDFIRTQGVVGLAVGVVIGTQVKTLVDSFVIGFVNPLLGIALPGDGNIALKTFHLSYNDKTATFLWGAFVTQFISFLIVLLIVYLTIHYLKLDQLDKKKDKDE